jgi:hypothetical protein
MNTRNTLNVYPYFIMSQCFICKLEFVGAVGRRCTMEQSHIHVSIKFVSKMAQSAYSVLKLLYADWQFWTQIWWQHRMLDCSIKKIKCKKLVAQINLKGKMADSPIIWIALNSRESSDNLNTIRPKNLANNFLAESSHKFKAYGRKFFFLIIARIIQFFNRPNHSFFSTGRIVYRQKIIRPKVQNGFWPNRIVFEGTN